MRKVPKHIQDKVDQYIELDAQMKTLQAELKKLRGDIEPHMVDNNVPVIKGTVRGSISLKPRDMAVTSARYTSYDVDGVVSLLDAKAKRKAVVQVIDKEVLEFLVKTHEAPPEVNNYKIMKPTVAFTINHK